MNWEELGLTKPDYWPDLPTSPTIRNVPNRRSGVEVYCGYEIQTFMDIDYQLIAPNFTPWGNDNHEYTEALIAEFYERKGYKRPPRTDF